MISPLIFCLAILPLALGEKIHKRMTTREVEQIFQTTPDAVPDYEVVQLGLSRLVKRGATPPARVLKLVAFGQNLQLWLHPTDGILAGKNTPVMTAEKNAKGTIDYKVYPNAMKNVGKLLEDPKTKTSVVVHRDSKGRRSINGHIASKKLVIRSLPESYSDDLLKNNHNMSSTNSRNTRSAFHIVFKREDKRIGENYKSRVANNTRTRVSRNTKPPPIPSVLYPEIMVVVDPTLFAINNNDIDKTLAYVVTFWNGVDLLYRSFEDPKFRFSISRVVIAKDVKAVPYITDNIYYKPTMFDAYEAIEDAARYYFELNSKIPYSSYDTVVTLTRLSMGDGEADPYILGIMPKNGMACVVQEKKKYVMKNAIIRDSGSFDGVHSAAHEFAHLLGSGHDEWVTCRPKDSYIMSSTGGFTEHSHDFSVCTVEDIQEWLNENNGACMYDKPKIANPLPRALPGHLRTRDDQCKMLKKGNSCYSEAKKHRPCTAVYCNDPKDPKKCVEDDEFAPPDGFFCSAGKVCLHGQCLKIK